MKNIEKFNLVSFVSGNTALLAVFILIALGGFLYGNMFLSYSNNFINVLHQASMMGIMGVGVNLCAIVGARDMSVAAVAAATSMIVSMLSPHGIALSILAGLLFGLTFGALNGFVIAKFKVQPFIATLGTQLAARGFALILNKELSYTLSPSAGAIKYLGNGVLFGLIPIPLLIFLILVIVFSIALKFTYFGRSIYAVGGNEEAAEMMGVRTDFVKISVFGLCGLMAAFAGIVLCGRLNAGQPTACEGWEMTILAAIVIGGTPVRGGSGRISGIFFGVVFVQLISNLINLNGQISPYWKDITTGLILLAAVLIQVAVELKKERANSKRKLALA